MPDLHARPFHLDGFLQHYDWGGYNFLPNFLGRSNQERLPAAEIWYGTHPKGPAGIMGTDRNLLQAIDQDPVRLLNSQVAGRYDNRLPYLLKVLDVREMLSIQIHPDKNGAELGFAKEEADGPERTAPNRNYRDDNHKPELGVALTDFYLLHGFKSENDVESTLIGVSQWQEHLLPVLRSDGVAGLYRYVMTADQKVVDKLLSPLAMWLAKHPVNTPDSPAYWAERAFKKYDRDGHHDRGVFSIFWLNIVHLRPGEGIFQAAGVPHAYLRGTCIELMANSDNVIRGGLTPKHVDVKELLRHISFAPVSPTILYPQMDGDEDAWDVYQTPAADFELQVIRRTSGSDIFVSDCDGPSILLLTEGQVTNHRQGILLNQRQRALFLPAGEPIDFEVNSDATMYRATVGRAGLRELDAGIGHHVSDA